MVKGYATAYHLGALDSMGNERGDIDSQSAVTFSFAEEDSQRGTFCVRL